MVTFGEKTSISLGEEEYVVEGDVVVDMCVSLGEEGVTVVAGVAEVAVASDGDWVGVTNILSVTTGSVDGVAVAAGVNVVAAAEVVVAGGVVVVAGGVATTFVCEDKG